MFAKLNAIEINAGLKRPACDLNFAIKAAMVVTLIDANRVAYTTGTPGSRPLEPADLADQTRAISAFAVCR